MIRIIDDNKKMSRYSANVLVHSLLVFVLDIFFVKPDQSLVIKQKVFFLHSSYPLKTFRHDKKKVSNSNIFLFLQIFAIWFTMPLFRLPRAKTRPKQRVFMKKKLMPSSWRTDDDGSVVPLTRLCLLSLVENMKNIWAKDYADNYMDHYSFRYIMGPFNCLREFMWTFFFYFVLSD